MGPRAIEQGNHDFKDRAVRLSLTMARNALYVEDIKLG